MSARASTSLLEGATRLRCIPGRANYAHEKSATRGMRTIARAHTRPAAGEEHALPAVPTQRRSGKDAYSLSARAPEASGSNLAVSELQKRFAALDKVMQEEVEMAAQPAPDELPEFSEAELLGFYEDVLSLPAESSAEASSSAPPRAIADGDSRIQALADTFAPSPSAATESNTPSSSILPVLQQRLESSATTSAPLPDALQTGSFPELQALPAYQRVVYRLKQTVPELARIRQEAAPGSVPVVLLTMDDWTTLVRTCMKHDDVKSAEDVLGLMKTLEGDEVVEPATDLMAYYAKRGDIVNTERLLQTYQSDIPTERQRDIHVQAHIRATPRNSIPESALAVVHAYEAQNAPVPLGTYNAVITNLFTEARSSVASAQAWDLYGHMRYVAHPAPDAPLYATMIRACAPPNGAPEPERALDLFTEMTVDNGLEPTQAAYNAVIYACARAGSQAYVAEAFRLARQMLDARRDARGRAQFRADGATFGALLEGAKRRGDLARTRWILAELVGEVSRARAGEAPPVVVTDETLVHVFHAYAAYRPPRVQVRSVPDAAAPEPAEASASPADAAAPTPKPSSTPAKRPAASTRAHLPPQSRAEVLREAQNIFERVVGEVKAQAGPFATVRISPRLIDAYLSVHYAHAALPDAAALFDTLFAAHGVRRGPRALVSALERCAVSRTGADRAAAVPFAARAWAEWEAAEDAAVRRGAPLGPRLVEQAHVAALRTHALAGDVPRALDLVRNFVARYPPARAREPGAQPAFRSSRTRLELDGARPLVRLTPATDVADDAVPPQLTWADVDVLHHRCVAAGRADGIRYIKWVCHAYRGALKVRREKFLGVEEDVERRRREKERTEREVLDIVRGSMRV